MRYPTIPRSRCDEIALARIGGGDPPLGEQWVGDGQDVNLSRIEDAASEIDALMDEHGDTNDKDYVEGLASTKLYAALCPADPSATGVPDVPVLDDPGFWRFLALAHFWDFIKWRQPGPFTNGNHMYVLDNRNARDTVLTRMYLRIASVGGLEHAEYAERLKKSTDFWQSHVFNVRTASAPALVHAMVNRQKTDRLDTKPLRRFAKRVSGMWTNVLLELYNDEEAAELVRELWQDGE